MKATVYKCDGCGAEKREANHWYLAEIKGWFLVYRWGELKENDGYNHYCGLECLTKALAQWAQ